MDACLFGLKVRNFDKVKSAVRIGVCLQICFFCVVMIESCLVNMDLANIILRSIIGTLSLRTLYLGIRV